jgi:predicted DCC family thiol-disulfide oxidoreductase YuxK
MPSAPAETSAETPVRAARPLPPRLILYDNVCGFCDASVQYLLDRDQDGRFRFAALQGEVAADLRSKHPEALPYDVDTVVYVDNTSDELRILLRSRAIFAIFGELDGPLRRLHWLSALPQPLTDIAYRAFAAMRYRLFGKLDSCRIPSPEERERFLD